MKHGRARYYHLDSGQMQEGIWREDYCVYSILIDIPYRQTAIYPTSYPIVPVKFKRFFSDLNAITTILFCRLKSLILTIFVMLKNKKLWMGKPNPVWTLIFPMYLLRVDHQFHKIFNCLSNIFDNNIIQINLKMSNGHLKYKLYLFLIIITKITVIITDYIV